MNDDQIVNNILRVAVFKNSEHDTVDDLDEVFNLELYASINQILVNKSLILVFIYQLSQSKVNTHPKKSLINVSDNVLALDTCLK